MRGPLTLLRELWENEDKDMEDEARTTYEYAIGLRDRLKDTCQLASEELVKVGDWYQAHHDKFAKDRILKSGQKALLLLPTDGNKLLAEWKGPFEVIKKLNKWNYVIDINGVERKFHINMLKWYYN